LLLRSSAAREDNQRCGEDFLVHRRREAIPFGRDGKGSAMESWPQKWVGMVWGSDRLQRAFRTRGTWLNGKRSQGAGMNLNRQLVQLVAPELVT